MVRNQVRPITHLVPVYVALEDRDRMSELFWSKKVFTFYAKEKRVIGERLAFSIRAMRINEFLDILDDNNIGWKLE